MNLPACADYGSKGHPENIVPLPEGSWPPTGTKAVCPNPACALELKELEPGDVELLLDDKQLRKTIKSPLLRQALDDMQPAEKPVYLWISAVTLLVVFIAAMFYFKPSWIPCGWGGNCPKDPRALVEKYFKPIDSQIPH